MATAEDDKTMKPPSIETEIHGEKTFSGQADAKGRFFRGMTPVMLGMESDEQLILNLRQAKSEYALDRFLLCAPGVTVRLGEIRDEEFYRSLGRRILDIKTALGSDGIEIGLWCTPVFKAGVSSTSMPLTDIEGNVSDVSYCPLDKDWSAKTIGNLAALIAECHPSLILLEDDFELSNHPNVHFGCFCQRHLEEFSRQCGRFLSREELKTEFMDGNVALRREWGRLSRKTLVDFARRLRLAVDAVSPESRIGLCQAGCSRFDGDFAVPVARALAGENHRPLIRVCGSAYSSDDSLDIIDALAFFKHCMETMPPDVELVHETDSWPHNAFFVSGRKLDSLLTAALSYGAEGSLYYAFQYLDHPLEERNYLEVWKSRLPKWRKIAELVERHSDPVSFIRATYRADNCCGVRYDGRRRPMSLPNCWLNALGRYGFDASYLRRDEHDPSTVIFVDGQDLRVMELPEILTLLGMNIVLDGTAALHLTQLGLGRHLGLRAERSREKAAFLYERIRQEAMTPRIAGRLMYNFVLLPAGKEGGGFVRLDHLAPETEVITDFIGGDGRPAQPGMVLYKNEWGGQVLTTAYEMAGNASSSIFNNRKRELFAEMIERMSGREIPFRARHANVFTILRRSREKRIFYAVLIPLGSDSMNEIHCSWRCQPREIRSLADSGEWQEVIFAAERHDGVLECALERLKPLFLEISS